MANEFLQRDLKNLTNYFRRQGAETSIPDIMARLKHERRWKGTDEEKADDNPTGAEGPREPGKPRRPARARRNRGLGPGGQAE
jgi:hypothetical protein